MRNDDQPGLSDGDCILGQYGHVVPEDKSTHEAGSKVVTYTGYVHGVD